MTPSSPRGEGPAIEGAGAVEKRGRGGGFVASEPSFPRPFFEGRVCRLSPSPAAGMIRRGSRRPPVSTQRPATRRKGGTQSRWAAGGVGPDWPPHQLTGGSVVLLLLLHPAKGRRRRGGGHQQERGPPHEASTQPKRSLLLLITVDAMTNDSEARCVVDMRRRRATSSSGRGRTTTSPSTDGDMRVVRTFSPPTEGGRR